MNLRILCACLIAMLLFSASAVAELIPLGDGRTSGSASASASHGNYYDSDSDDGDNGYLTTVAGYFSYNYDVGADMEAFVYPYDEAPGGVSGVASGDASGPIGEAQSAYLYCNVGSTTEVYEYDPAPDDPPEYNGYGWFDAYTGVYASWIVIANAGVENNSWSQAGVWAQAYASANMQ